MLQDLKVGHILGGTPWKMQVGDVIGVIFAGAVMFFPLYLMHTSDIAQFGPTIGGFGGKTYAAPQAGLMAALSQGIVGGEMAWPLVLVGIAMGISLILVKVRSPMLFSVGMYLPLETTFAIFVGGLIRGRRGQDARQARLQRGAEGAGRERGRPGGVGPDRRRGAGRPLHRGRRRVPVGPQVPADRRHFDAVGGWLAIPVMLAFAAYLIWVPLGKAGAADEPAPPTAVM